MLHNNILTFYQDLLTHRLLEVLLNMTFKPKIIQVLLYHEPLDVAVLALFEALLVQIENPKVK